MYFAQWNTCYIIHLEEIIGMSQLIFLMKDFVDCLVVQHVWRWSISIGTVVIVCFDSTWPHTQQRNNLLIVTRSKWFLWTVPTHFFSINNSPDASSNASLISVPSERTIPITSFRFWSFKVLYIEYFHVIFGSQSFNVVQYFMTCSKQVIIEVLDCHLFFLYIYIYIISCFLLAFYGTA